MANAALGGQEAALFSRPRTGTILLATLGGDGDHRDHLRRQRGPAPGLRPGAGRERAREAPRAPGRGDARAPARGGARDRGLAGGLLGDAEGGFRDRPRGAPPRGGQGFSADAEAPFPRSLLRRGAEGFFLTRHSRAAPMILARASPDF